MRFLIDEMFSPDVASRLRELGHDAVHVHELGLSGASDADVFERAVGEDRVTVTENTTDFLALLEDRTAAGRALTAVLIALKRNLPSTAGGLAHGLATRLDTWAADHPTPYRHVHWLG